jgi:hypothetical protein
MPVARGQSQFNFGASIKKHAKDETDYGQDFSRLPGGIIGGIAKLVEARLNKYKTGKNIDKQHLYLVGVVIQPKRAVQTIQEWKDGKVNTISSQEIRVEGLQTRQILPLDDFVNSKGVVTGGDENVAAAMNALRILGGEECTNELSSEEDFKALLSSLVESGIHFRFTTNTPTPTADYPNPITFERWNGTKGLEDYSNLEENGQAQPVQDNTPAAADTADIEALAAAASGGDEDAAEKLKNIAVEAGVSEKEVDSANDWSDVPALIEAAKSDGSDQPQEPAEEESAKDWKPAKGELYNYKPPKAKKPIEVEVTGVNFKNKMVNLKGNDNPKLVWKDVKWDALEAS